VPTKKKKINLKERPKDYWTSKLKTTHGLPKVSKIEGKMTKRWGTGTVAIPAPMEVNNIMKRVPKGKLITINQIRTKVARKHKASMGCPITCGIFAWISANASDEQKKQGKKNTTPYWRTLKGEGELNPKYPGGILGQAKNLRVEGHKIKRKGKKYTVAEYQKKLVKI
jgi:hypothetical protein